MKKELNIISEIFRMREIMGVGTLSYSSKKYIQEQTNDMSKYLLTEATVQPDPAAMARLFKVLGMDDSTAAIFGRSIADNWDAGAKGFIELLEKNGLDDITKLQGKIAAIRGIDVSTVTKEMVDDAMAKYFKNNTDIAENILKSNSDFVKNSLAGKSFADILRTVDAQLGMDIDTFVRNTDITLANAGTLKSDLLDISSLFKNSGLDMNNATNKEFADLLDSYAKAADALDGSSTKIKEPTPEAVTIPKEEITKKSSSEGSGIGDEDFKSFKSNWIKEVNDETDQRALGVVTNESQRTFKNLPNEFNPSDITIGRTNTYNFIQKDEKTNWLPIERSRTQIEVTLPNGEKILMYSSSGANEGSTGKKAGEWFWLPGFAKSGWYIKTRESINFTKGGNKYMTDFAKVLETNGYEGVKNGTSVVKNLPKIQNGYLATKFGDTSKINWVNVKNAKNISDYDVIIDNAIKTGNFNSVSRFGFENYGIPNFRKYLKDIYN
jgi:hypothetical protein